MKTSRSLLRGVFINFSKAVAEIRKLQQKNIYAVGLVNFGQIGGLDDSMTIIISDVPYQIPRPDLPLGAP